MKLWLISQTVDRGYDTYDSAVVAAQTEEQARLIHPTGDVRWNGRSWMVISSDGKELYTTYGAWAEPAQVVVKYIGQAAKNTKAGVICASYNAG